MTTSYLFAYYTLDSQVSLSSCMSIETGLFFFLTFCNIISPISGIYNRSLLHYGKLKKKLGENKNKLRTIYPKNQENSNNSKPRVQFYWFLKNACIDVKCKKWDLTSFSNFFHSFFMRTKALVFVKNLRIS